MPVSIKTGSLHLYLGLLALSSSIMGRLLTAAFQVYFVEYIAILKSTIKVVISLCKFILQRLENRMKDATCTTLLQVLFHAGMLWNCAMNTVRAVLDW